MRILPVIVRELREQGRLVSNYWLRVISALVLALIFTMIHVFSDSGGSAGWTLFCGLNFVVALFIWILVPFMVADCVSEEKRNGTLGLLFLTPLKPADIIFGKSLMHFIRAVILIVAGIPVLLLPFMLGGVGWQDTAFAIVIHFSSICMSLSAGLVATSICRERTRAFMVAIALSFTYCFFATLYLVFFFNLFVGGDVWVSHWGAPPMSGIPRFKPAWLASGFVALGLVVFLAAVFRSSNQLRIFWREEPLNSRRLHSFLFRTVHLLGWVFLFFCAIGETAFLYFSPPLMSSGDLYNFFDVWYLLFHLSLWGVVPVFVLHHQSKLLFQRRGEERIRLTPVAVAFFFSYLAFFAFVFGHAAILGFSDLTALSLAVLNLLAVVYWISAVSRLLFARRPEFANALIWLLLVLPISFVTYYYLVEKSAEIFATTLPPGDTIAEKLRQTRFMGGLKLALLGERQDGGWLSVFTLQAGFCFVLSATFYAVVVRLIAPRWEKKYQVNLDDPSREIRKTFVQPVLGRKFLKRRLARLLDRNPIVWLHQHTWGFRVSKWAWLLITILYETMVVLVWQQNPHETMNVYQYSFALLMMGGIAFSASGTFRKERQSGALELILVTPVKVRQIVWGRVNGILRQYGPSLFVIGLVSLMIGTSSLGEAASNQWMMMTAFALMFLNVIPVGLWMSLLAKNQFFNWSVSLLLVCVAPLLMLLVVFQIDRLLITDMNENFIWFVWVSYEVLIGFYTWNNLVHRLATRRFSFAK